MAVIASIATITNIVVNIVKAKCDLRATARKLGAYDYNVHDARLDCRNEHARAVAAPLTMHNNHPTSMQNSLAT